MKARVTEGWERLYAAAQEREGTEGIEEAVRAWNPMVRVPVAGYDAPGSFRRRVEEMVDAVGRLSVTTFHSFCARVLRSFPAEAGVDPLFEVLSGGRVGRRLGRGVPPVPARGVRGGRRFAGVGEDPLEGAGPGKVWGVIRRLCLTQRDLFRGPPPDFGTPADFLGLPRRDSSAYVEYFRAFVAGIRAPGDDPAAPAFRDALPRPRGGVGSGPPRGPRAAASRRRRRGRGVRHRPPQEPEQEEVPPPGGPLLSEVRDALRKLFRLLDEVPAGDAAARFLLTRADAALAAYERRRGAASTSWTCCCEPRRS